ncbi:MAG: LPS-assembly protein LptD [Chlamydiota bacterium]
MSKKIFLLLLISALTCSLNHVYANNDTKEKLEELFAKGIIVDLRDPSYKDGVLSTKHGGVITGDKIRIQAQRIKYIRKIDEDEQVIKVTASGDVMVEYGDRIFIGEKLEYDFVEERGTVYDAKTNIENWYIGGEFIELRPDQSFFIKRAYVSSCESAESDWQLAAQNIIIKQSRILSAHSIQMRFIKVPVFWIPSFSANIDTLMDAPFTFKMRWGGGHGARFNLGYRFWANEYFKGVANLDYSWRRGWGGGIDTHYEYEPNNEKFYTHNFIAYDRTRHERRFRFDGIYQRTLGDERTFLDLKYDRLSDRSMASDYHDKDFDLKTAGMTALTLQRQRDNWTGSFLSRLRINSFQTITQELPTFHLSNRPFNLGDSGFITNNQATVSYLDLKYADGLPTSYQDYNSTRLMTHDNIYRPFKLHKFTLTPDVGVVGIFYGNSPNDEAKWLGMLTANFKVQTIFSRYNTTTLQTSEPYVEYQYHSNPTTDVPEHYVFDINDGLAEINIVTAGIKNSWYSKDQNTTSRQLMIDLYTKAILNTKAANDNIARLYSDITWTALDNLNMFCNVAWNCNHNVFDQLGLRSEWTYNENLALSAEYRKRGQYNWRRADHTNYILDAFRQQNSLRDSRLSDKNDIILAKAFYRFSPRWSSTFHSRHGWNRQNEKPFNEYNIELATILNCTWEVKLSYQRKINDQRFAIRINLVDPRPQTVSSKLPSLKWS